jgi:hypothetical protein
MSQDISRLLRLLSEHASPDVPNHYVKPETRQRDAAAFDVIVARRPLKPPSKRRNHHVSYRPPNSQTD